MKADILFSKRMLKKILFVGLIIGCMDAAAAIINGYLTSGVRPGSIFQYIASGLFGMEAFGGGFAMVIVGIVIHFFIATVATGIFFICYISSLLTKGHYLLLGAGYGVLVWLVMNLIVIPLSATPPATPGVSQIMIGLLIHIFVIGIPIGFFANRYVDRLSPT